MNEQYKFNQYEHKSIYGLPRTAKLKGFVVVNEDKEDMLAGFRSTQDSLICAYTENPKQACIFKTIDKAKAIIEEIGKPLLVSAMYETKGTYAVACFIKYEPSNGALMQTFS